MNIWKNVLLSILVVTSVCFGLQAQNLGVVSFTELHNDLDARVNFPKIDQNGKKCAILKVMGCDGLNMSGGFRFDVGSMGIVEVVHNTGEWWVYVPTPIRKISVFHDVYGSIRNHELGIPIKEATCYELKLRLTGGGASRVPNAPFFQYVIFRTDLSDVLIHVNGKSLVPQKGAVSTKLPIGQYEYEASAPKYEDLKGTLTVDASKERQEINLKMVPAYKRVTLLAGEGMEIWVDGTKKGIGSWTGDLEYSSYGIECRKTSHHAAYQDITITKDSPSTIQLPAPSPMYGSIVVSVEPAGADVFLDGDSKGIAPTSIYNVLVGSHHLTVVMSGYTALETDITVEEGVVHRVTGLLTEYVKPVTGIHAGHEYVDLDLPSGTLWATCNIGAETPEDYGDYFAWGETTGYKCGKIFFNWEHYIWCDASDPHRAPYRMTKYCSNRNYGTCDDKKRLVVADDAAHDNWGGKWRIPSRPQVAELISECNAVMVNQNDVWGMNVTSKKNGNCIFLPFSGVYVHALSYKGVYGQYWTCSGDGDNKAAALDARDFKISHWNRCDGLAVRPVLVK